MGALKHIVIFILLLTLFPGLAQEFDTIPWSADRRLKWTDFKGNPPNGDRAAATTASGLTYRFSSLSRNGEIELDFEVHTFFYPHKSWYKPDLCDELTLSHEQLHFDIAELKARKMRRIIAETRFTDNIKAEIRAIYRDIIKELNAFQNRYDTETNFSRNRAQQLAWNKKIRNALRE